RLAAVACGQRASWRYISRPWSARGERQGHWAGRRRASSPRTIGGCARPTLLLPPDALTIVGSTTGGLRDAAGVAASAAAGAAICASAARLPQTKVHFRS